MLKPPQELIDGFFEWFNNDQHKDFEDYYQDRLTKEKLASLSQKDFVAFFVEFAGDGGKIQSGGHRNKNKLKETIEQNFQNFRSFILDAFQVDLQVEDWLKRSEEFRYFGNGLATIFLNRIDKQRHAIVNNKTADALALLGAKLPTDFIKRYEAVKMAQKQLIEWSPEFENFYRTDAFNHYLIGTEEGKVMVAALQTNPTTKTQNNVRYWICSLGPRSKYWDECLKKNIAVFGFNELQPLSEYPSKQKIADAITKETGRKKPSNDALAGWQIVNEVKVGDVLIVKRGRKTYLGYGIVTGDYYYDKTRPTYRNIIPVKWKNSGEWEEDSGDIVLKTLTDITQYDDYVQKLIRILNIETATNTKLQPANLPKNLILYGPPGTGKTYMLRDEYFKLFTDQQKRKTKMDFADELAASTGWWETIAMVMLDLKEASVTEIMEHSLMAAKVRLMQNKYPRAAVWGQLQSHTKNDCPHVNYTKRLEPLVFWKDENSIWSIDMGLVESELKDVQEKLDAYRNFVEQETTQKRYLFTTFHQSYSYEEFVEGIKPRIGEEVEESAGEVTYEIKPGVFRQIVDMAIADPERPYAIFIDEISRGNVASIFGELITLIEDDKRQGAENEMNAVLPYSRQEFFVPDNLHIIGTMNTADRSVVALDNALRRRFCFEEMMPNYDVIVQPDGLKVDLRVLLETINGRIERLLDRDHVIGHSYFMSLVNAADSLKGLQDIFTNKVLPLLQEYFYGDPDKIGLVLGEAFVKADGNGTPFAPGSWQEDIYEDSQVLRFISPGKLSAEDFRSVYES